MRAGVNSLQTATDPYAPLRGLMRRHGASCSPKEFYWAVNSAYHAVEAAQYDELHADMYAELPPVWRRLLGHLPASPTQLRFLDIGAGTGLVGEFLQEMCPDHIGALVLLEPCEAMIEIARKKSEGWSFATEFVQGDISALGGDSLFDVVTANSVLHHIVDLGEFCGKAESLVRPGGVLLTAQDSRADAPSDSVFLKRRGTVARRSGRGLCARTQSLAARAVRRIRPGFRLGGLAEAANAPLLNEGVIKSPMTLAAIWSVTDFHVPGQIGGMGRGISFLDLERYMGRMTLVDSATYHFHGSNWQSLTQAEKERELGWWNAGDPHGEMFCTAWQRKEGL